MGSIGRADTNNPLVAETDEEIPKQVVEFAIQARAAHTCVNLHITNLVAAQHEDPVFKATINWISNQKVHNLKHLLGDEPNIKERIAVLQVTLLSLPHTCWQAGRSFAVHSPLASSSGCFEQMSQRCWTSRSAANAVPTAGSVLVAWHGCVDAESDQQL